MIDPKFNALPVDAAGDFEESPEGSVSRTQTRPRQGLSINDTVAANANLSVGARGVDTSGTAVGAGAGAGMTLTTPGNQESPAPMIIPGSRGSGTTIHGASVPEPTAATRLEAGTETTGTSQLTSDTSPLTASDTSPFTTDEVSERAYHHWFQRGCPHGSPEVDWETAVEQLRREKERAMSANA